MSSERDLRVAILWHMHQPDYRIGGIPQQPWVHLHSLKGYADMASHLEAVPAARAVVNFSPVLLDQIVEAAEQVRAAATQGRTPADPLAAALLHPPAGPARARTLRACLRAHEHHGYGRFPEYAGLAWRCAAALNGGPDAVAALEHGDVTDLVVWYYLVWLGEHARRTDPRIAELSSCARGFTAAQCRLLLTVIAETLEGIVPRYRALAVSGRVELSVTPYYHPLLPLLIDFSAGVENAPGTTVPPDDYPGGEARARWHLEAGRRRFEEIFGLTPRGCWPSEAALSEPAARQIQAAGFDWMASSGSVLAATLHRHGIGGPAQPSAYRLSTPDGAPRRCACFFRDDGLSDRIGFVYKDWRADDAVADLVQHVERAAAGRPDRFALLALDGENPWEYYAGNGLDFVRGLYRALAAHPRLRMVTLSEMASGGAALDELPRIVAGSWVHGQLLTWIGHPEKNRAWAMLVDAKRRFDAAPNPTPAAQRALAACEGSDWFWWPGTHHTAASISDFDALFRARLGELYRELGEPEPEILQHPFASAARGPGTALGAMLPGS